jgi:trimeric autotransporter adhesin
MGYHTTVVKQVITLGLSIFIIVTIVLGIPSPVSAATVTLWPNGTGDTTGLSRFPGSGSNYERVTSADADDTSYVQNSSSTVSSGLHDLYQLEDTSVAGTINSVTVTIVCRANSTANNRRTFVATKLKTNSTLYSGTETTQIPTTYTSYSTVYTTNPNTSSAWTWTEVNNLQVGPNIRIQNTGNPGRCTQVSATVDYVPPEVSISLSTDGTVTFGTQAESAQIDTTVSGTNDAQTVAIDSGPADLDVRSTVFSDGSNTWSLGGSAGTNQVLWEFSKDATNWSTFLAADTLYALDTNVAQSATRNMYLRLVTPATTSSFLQHTATVTIVASTP